MDILTIQDGDPPHTFHCLFDSSGKNRSRCSAFTRTSILTKIAGWICIESFRPYPDHLSMEDSDATGITADDCCIFWINRSGGTGKTTIAFTIAEDCRRHGVLGASFFCSRDDAECSNPQLIHNHCVSTRTIPSVVIRVSGTPAYTVSTRPADRETSTRTEGVISSMCNCVGCAR